jgi:hypothetical protein
MTLATTSLTSGPLSQLGTTSVPVRVTQSHAHAGSGEMGPTESIVGPGVSYPVFNIRMIADFWKKFHLTTTPALSLRPPFFSPAVSCEYFIIHRLFYLIIFLAPHHSMGSPKSEVEQPCPRIYLEYMGGMDYGDDDIEGEDKLPLVEMEMETVEAPMTSVQVDSEYFNFFIFLFVL